MLLLLSSSRSGLDPVQDGGGSRFQFGVGAGSDLEATKTLVGHSEGRGKHADRDARALALGPQPLAGWVVGCGVEQGGVDLVGDVA